MKKLLSLLFVLFMGMTMWAETVDFSAQGYANGQAITEYVGDDFTVTFDKGTNSNAPKYYTTGTAIRIYGGGYFTVSSTKTITKIEIGFGTGDDSNEITTDVVTYSNGVWEGNASAVKFTIGGTNGHRRVKTITVTLSGETPPEPPTPTITEIATAAEFIALENNKEFKFTGELVCVQDYVVSGVGSSGQPYTNRYLYVADETGGIVIYNPDTNAPAYETKDVIPGGWTAKKTTYRGLPEATTATDFTEATETLHLDPIEMTIDDANASNNYGAYVIIKNVLIRPQSDNMLMEENGPSTHDESVMITDGGGNNIILYSNHTAPFNLPTDWETDTRYDIVGILGVYNSTQQIYPVGIKLNDETITSITNVEPSAKKVIYYNTQGIQSSTPHDGLNIVVTEFENGTKNISKQIYKF